MADLSLTASQPTPVLQDGKTKMKQGAGKRLNDKQRVEIIQLAETTKITKRHLAEKYGVSEAAIRKLLLKKDEFVQRYYETPEEIRDQRLRGKSVRSLMTQELLPTTGLPSDPNSSTGVTGLTTFASGRPLYSPDEPWMQGLSSLAGNVLPFMKTFVQGKLHTSEISRDVGLAAAEGAGPMDLEGMVPSKVEGVPLSAPTDWIGFARTLRDIRRTFHRHPETGFQEFHTQAFINRYCQSSLCIPEKNIRVVATTGLVVDVCYENGIIAPNEKRKLPVLAFRAEMDALPIEEMNDHLTYCSQRKQGHTSQRTVAARKPRKKRRVETPFDQMGSTANVDMDAMATSVGQSDEVHIMELGGAGTDLSTFVPSASSTTQLDEFEVNDHNQEAPPAAHMCGHDGHMVMVLGLLTLIVRQAHLLPRDTFVRFIFQPAEEGPGGAQKMIEGLALNEVDEVYGLHNYPFPLYSVHVRPGPVMAHEVEFSIDIDGVGGHGSAPQNCVDPILVGANIVQALQSIVSRAVSPQDTAVVSVTQFRGGNTNNVIPAHVTLGGTIRDFDLQLAEKIKQRMETIVHSTCAAAGAHGQVHFTDGYPPVINPAEQTRLVQQVSIDTGLYVSEEGLPLMAAEDFAYYLNERKGCFFLLGTKEACDDEKTRALHSNAYDFNDKVIPLGIRCFLGVLQARLNCQLYPVEDLQDFQVAMERIVL